MKDEYSNGRDFLSAMDKLNHGMRRVRVCSEQPKGSFGILLALDHHRRHLGEERLRQGKMCTILHRSMPSITRSVNSLEEEGLVERSTSKSDRRAVNISLTEKGRATIEQCNEAMFGFLDGIFLEMGQEDTEDLLRLLHKMGDILQRTGEKEEC